MNSEPTVLVKELSTLIYKKRKDSKLTLEKLTKETGVSPATLSRLEKQRLLDEITFTPSMKTVASLTRWLGIPIQEVVVGDIVKQDSLEVEDHLKAVQIHLRAKKNLNDESIGILTDIFSLAFAQHNNLTNEGKDDEVET